MQFRAWVRRWGISVLHRLRLEMCKILIGSACRGWEGCCPIVVVVYFPPIARLPMTNCVFDLAAGILGLRHLHVRCGPCISGWVP